MSQLARPTEVKFFISALYNTENIDEKKLLNILEQHISLDSSFEPEFNPLTEYYSKEMGNSLKRVIWVDKTPKPREELVRLKLLATKNENENLNSNNGRNINIDIGYIAMEQVVLATGKPYSHRLYLNNGVYAELVYIYQNKTYHKVPWTYPDYQHQEKIDFFNRIR